MDSICLLPIIITLGDIYLALLCVVINIVINMLFYCCTLRALYLDIFKFAAIFFFVCSILSHYV
jgi:hypothetical protein